MPAPKRKKSTIKSEFTGIRSTRAFKTWLFRFAKKEECSPGELLGQGVAELAKLRGFVAPPPR